MKKVSRRDFLGTLAGLSLISIEELKADVPFGKKDISDFCKKLKPVGRILQTEGYYVWCNAPIYAPDGKVHVFYSRWADKYKMGGWIHKSEIAHAVADSPESEFKYVETILAPRGNGFWDGTTCHNPHIQFIDGKYCLFYMGNSNGKTNTKRIGLATADSLDGPWIRPDKPLFEAGSDGSWDDHCTTNPAFLKHPNGEYWLYYKSWNSKEYTDAKNPTIKGNRKYGLAIAKNLEGPYVRYEGNPIVDFSGYGENRQVEDAYIYYEKKKFKMIMRDMGFFNHTVGLYFESKDGIHWAKPKIAFHGADTYIKQLPPPPHLTRYGRFERPQILMKDGKPAYLFTTTQGGDYMTSSGFVFKIEP
ncbi:glycoside hydrolase family protein [Arcicella sp. LKC2W]|uniref:glycoside hydrolase family protein n=1 Tax=Arcicella sp. LKC2W TaxID=2984198 RepID=UPI002B1FAE59|nr:glycoside hydrolase family protein [Arcicella sp. LKC2W]MEA5458351.1 glycoside hydrolase family protein [Arcicella sp. LKC2W]